MKKLLLAAMIAVLAVANSANAKIYRTERYWAESDPFNMMPSSKRNQLVSGCADLGYLNAPPAGKTCTTIQNNGLTCYKDCKCPSTHTKACKGTGEKGVGTRCDDLYASCTCTAKFKYCSGTEVGGGDVCTADGGYKYSECTCTSAYKEKCDGVGVVGVDAPCGGLYKSCKCDSAYKYCTSGTEGDGEACTYDGGSKFKYCNTVAVEEVDNGENGSGTAVCTWNGGEVINAFAYMKGFLFDGGVYTPSIIEQANNAGVDALAANAAQAYSPYLEQKLVAEDSEHFKQGQWYLPSQGEMLQMYGCDWDKIAATLQNNEAKDYIAKGDFGWLEGICDGHNLAKLQNTLDKFKELGVVDEFDDLIEKYWTSSFGNSAETAAKDGAFLVSYGTDYLLLVMPRDSGYAVRPVTRVSAEEGFFKGAKIGQVITKKLTVLDPEQAMEAMWGDDPVMGMIYWVSPDADEVAVVAMHNARVDGKPSTTEPWAGEEQMNWGDSYAYEGISTNAWTCTGDEAEEPEEPEECNDYEKYTGPLFDGKANTDAILDVWGCDVDDPKASEAKAACAVHSFYPILQGVEKDHPIFGQGKWYLPSVGELMLMEADWNKVVGNLEAISAKWNEGDFEIPYDLWKSGNTETFDAVNATFQELYGRELGEKFWTSNEVNEEIVVMVRLEPGAGSDGIEIQSTLKESNTAILPIIKLAADKLNSSSGEEARPGMVVDKDMKFGNLDELDKDMVVGIIFFVSADGKTVWIMHRPLGTGVDEFNVENPYEGEDYSYFTFSPNGDVPGVKNDPWTCSGDLTSCTDGNDYQKFTGPLFDGKTNTQKLVAARDEKAQAAWLASQFYPHAGGVDVDEGDELFGRGKWYLPSIGELMMLMDMDWNMFAQAANNLNDEKRNNLDTLYELAVTYSNKDLSEVLVPAVEVLKEKWPDVNYIVNNYSAFIASSSEVGDGKNIYSSFKAKYSSKSYSFDGDNGILLPAVQLKTENLEKMDYEPEVGYFVGASRKYYDSGNADIGDIIGIIYWVSDDKQTLRVISPRAIGNDVENPFNSDPQIVFDTEGEVADVMAESVDYIYGEKQCTVIEGGEAMQPTCEASTVSKVGYNNTQAIVTQIDQKGLAAMACYQFYAPGVDKKDKTFGQDKWYLPSIGELMQLYGTDFTQVTEARGTSGAKGDNIAVINTALGVLKGKGAEADKLIEDIYWSSSEAYISDSWDLAMGSGNRLHDPKVDTLCVRAFQLCENCFTPLCLSPTAVPQIGDVMYADKTFGKASDYDGKKTPVGVITWVSDDGASAKIISLKDLTFSSMNQVGNFDPDNPYGNKFPLTYWATEDARNIDITAVENCDELKCLLASADSTSSSGGSSSGGTSGGSPAVCTSPKTNVGGSCQCPASYKETCTSPQTGVGQACDGKYTSCQCPASYKYTCVAPATGGVGEACDGKYESCYSNSEVTDVGVKNTKAIVTQIDQKGLAAMACATFYAPGVDKEDKTFGQGKWHLPSIGELMQLYGTDFTKVTEASGVSGAKGDNKEVINTALGVLHDKRAEADKLPEDIYWSSSEYSNLHSWILSMSNGGRHNNNKNAKHYVRAFQLCENCFTPLWLSPTSVPQIGDVMYADKSFGKARAYDGKKTAVGVIIWVSDDGASARIISLRDLTFTSGVEVGNFDPDNPYGNEFPHTYWATEDAKDIDITAVENCTAVDCMIKQ
ncbi:MAG: hypothetical protein IKK52_01700 [Alphaproteobacteria bacterium]|nr:hypothetical protein [Alphaproteobacteria bacterium]